MDNKINIAEVIFKLCPNAQFIVYENNIDKIEWHSQDVKQPSKQQILNELEKIKNKNNYEKKRLKEYPSIGDQLDSLFHAGIFPKDMAAQIQAVKDKYPKPE